MGSEFYVSSDREQTGPWPFTREQLEESVIRNWPGASVGEFFEGRHLEIQVEVEPGQLAELSFSLRHRVFSFADREPWSAPLTVIYTVLRELAPTVPVVWWIDYDATMEPLDLSADLQAFIRSFGT
ncbi:MULTISPECIES: hypothetical protein [unclassified Kitasatospora]|uniref:hypothetical protein n=1 Tax=unclassified Kitasatospora TaxID=2633591 RepID=UPI001AE086AD|nr:hypothetical protein [Kitasatospora sp. RG8]MBP0454031.1 hypothetical protein [Kitasatospora sp. RG8]